MVLIMGPGVIETAKPLLLTTNTVLDRGDSKALYQYYK